VVCGFESILVVERWVIGGRRRDTLETIVDCVFVGTGRNHCIGTALSVK